MKQQELNDLLLYAKSTKQLNKPFIEVYDNYVNELIDCYKDLEAELFID